MFLTIPCIIIIIILAIELSNKTNELTKLKQENDMLHENIYHMANKLNSIDLSKVKEKKEDKTKEKQELLSNIPENISNEFVVEPKKEINRNNLILITGSIFIVLAAFLFITSTWNVLPNIIKTLILFLMIFVFLGISYFAGEKLKIEKTSKAFFYIAMIYIPIVFYSVAYLGLLGNYFMDGKGLSLYLSITSAITAIIYVVYSKKEEKLLYANYLFQIIAVVNFGIFLNRGYEIIYLLLTFYNLAILIKNVYSKKESISNKLENILIIFLSIIITLNVAGRIFAIQMPGEFSISIELILSILLLLGVTFYRGKETSYIHGLSSLLCIVGVASVVTKINLPLPVQEILILLTLIAVYLRSEFYQKNSPTLDWIIIIITLVTLFLAAIQNTIWVPILIIITAIILNFYRYIKVKWDIHIALIIWLIALFYILIINAFDLGYYEFILFLTISEIITYLVIKNTKNEALHKIIEINTNIIILPNLIYFAITDVINGQNTVFLIPLVIMITSYLNYKEKKKSYNLLITYISSAILLKTINNLWMIVPYRYISFIIVTIILLIIKLLRKEKLKEEPVFIIQYIISLIPILFIEKGLNFLLAIISIILMLIYNEKYQHNKKIEYTSLIFLTLFLYIEKVTILGITINPIIGLIAIIYWMTKSYLSEERLTTDWLALTYIILDYIMYPLNQYFTIILLMVWSLANFDSKKKYHNFIKTVLYVNGLWLYNAIIHDTNLENITLLNLFGYFTTLYLFTRTILCEKYHELATGLEWGITIILCLIAIVIYQNELDGILFVSFLILMMAVSYLKKIEPTFYISLVFIIINAFLLTRTFWFSLPWWLYLLIIGFVLILFATNNELQTSVKRQKILKMWRKHFKDEV